MTAPPRLRPLHPDSSLSSAKLAIFEKFSTSRLVDSLAPGQPHCLKATPDGLILDGHHRVYVLRSRNENIDSLPREVIAPEQES